MTEKQSKIFGYLGSALSILMYVSYIPQIMGNLNGNKTSFIQPLVASINCTIWVVTIISFLLCYTGNFTIKQAPSPTSLSTSIVAE